MLQGVNLGNWLVLEKWMDATPFVGTPAEDEVWLNRDLSLDERVHRMTAHRDSYITEEDFDTLARAGITVLRLPVPYFVFGDRTPFIGCVEYVDKAFEWASARSMQILLDLHTVPGSQNGFDNGGLSGVVRWHHTESEIVFALGVLERLGRRYGKHKALYGIEVLNEPASRSIFRANKKRYPARRPEEAEGSTHVPIAFLLRFYKAAYKRLRAVIDDDKLIVFHDGFRLMHWLPIIPTELRHMRNIAFDTHVYYTTVEQSLPRFIQTFLDKQQLRPGLYTLMNAIQILRMRMIRLTGAGVIVGEWCAENEQSKKDGTSGRDFFDYQLHAFQQAGVLAEFMWSYQQERNPERRKGLTHSWKRFWDWRALHEV
ncbi:glycoside hydrolase family 5 protein [Alloscardovia criceti]|uniref:glycoside hydrolase family 5 protein n=1 Tax=Alloscardovia criceti TaxID=356828 RepID=UPI00037764D3|nr:cellulase family glycosylhydrolase [Alloscardovia criceti]